MKTLISIFLFTLSCLNVFSQSKAETGVFELLTDASTLKDGDEIILVAKDLSHGEIQYRTMLGFDKSNFFASSVLSDVRFGSDRQIICPITDTSVLRLSDRGSGKWYLMTSDTKCLHSVADSSVDSETKASAGLYSYVPGTTKKSKGYALCTISVDANGGRIVFDQGYKSSSSSKPRSVIKFYSQGGNAIGSFTCQTEDAQMYMYTCQIYRRIGDITVLSDNQSISTVVTPFKGSTADFRIDRTFTKDKLHTLCLPFNLTSSELIRIFGESTVVYEYSSVENGSSMVFRQLTGDIPAGTPCLIVPSRSVTNPPCFSAEVPYDIDIDGLHQVRYDDNYSFNGTLIPYSMKTDGTELFVNSNEGFSKPTDTENTMRGMRAFFRIPYSTDASYLALFLVSNSNGIQEMKLPLGRKTVAEGLFTIDGVYVGKSLRNANNGVYICNGKKVVVTDKR